MAPGHEITELVDGRVVLESMAGHKHDADGVSRLDEGPCRIGGSGHWFFDKHMLTCGDCFQTKSRMGGWRGSDDDCIDMRQGIIDVRVYRDVVIRHLMSIIDFGEPLIHAGDCGYSGSRPQHTQVPRTPITYSDDADPNSFRPHSNTPLYWSCAFGPYLEVRLLGALPTCAWNGTPA